MGVVYFSLAIVSLVAVAALVAVIMVVRSAGQANAREHRVMANLVTHLADCKSVSEVDQVERIRIGASSGDASLPDVSPPDTDPLVPPVGFEGVGDIRQSQIG